MLALDLPKTFNADTAFLVVDYATKFTMVKITYFGRYGAGLSLVTVAAFCIISIPLDISRIQSSMTAPPHRNLEALIAEAQHPRSNRLLH